MCYSNTEVRTATNGCVGSYSNFARAGRYGGEPEDCIYRWKKQGHLPQAQPPPPLTKRPRPTQPPIHRPFHPPIKRRNHHVLPQYSITYSSKRMRLVSSRFVLMKLVWGVGKSVRDVTNFLRNTQLEADVLYGTSNRFIFGRLSRPFCTFNFYLEVGVGVAISLDFDSIGSDSGFASFFFFNSFGGLGWGFYSVRGDINPGYFRSRPPVVGVDAWKDFRFSDGALCSPGCAYSMLEPQPISDRPTALGFYTPCEAVSIRESIIFVLEVLEV